MSIESEKIGAVVADIMAVVLGHPSYVVAMALADASALWIVSHPDDARAQALALHLEAINELVVHRVDMERDEG